MPKKAGSGESTAGLLAYLFGPGNHEEHTDPHLVAAWTPGLPCPARTPDRMTLSGLALLLDAPVDTLRGPKPAEHVWHVSVRNEPDDRVLIDAEWATVAAEMVAAAGIAPHGDTQACRWVAVRHADDHIHLVSTLARQDGRHPASAATSRTCTPPPAPSRPPGTSHRCHRSTRPRAALRSRGSGRRPPAAA
ncbi:hypothetical protein HLK56_33925 [Streptomyces sp. G9]|uniref:hypothetical protein n=1 Tax=Streptomyces sp. G9 TaxID=1684483 RepID=UPI003D755FD6